ncbi:MAG: aspartate racemase [Gammaproteobacteria bacterium]|nr:MAG: aspartate racemase [Gammaproteobacteria bacterium]
MKTIDLIGGMSWESTALYYRWINEGVKRELGGLHSARIALVSVDFQNIERLQHAGDWDAAGKVLAEAGRQVERVGAELLLICTNTMHKVADVVQAAVDIPLLHLADATAERLVADGRRRIGLLGTRFTMEENFYAERLRQHGLGVLVPDEADRGIVHRVIYEELCLGKVRDESRADYLAIIDRLGKAGAEAVIAGCTEITLLVQQPHTAMPLYDTTAIHAEVAVERALEGELAG